MLSDLYSRCPCVLFIFCLLFVVVVVATIIMIIVVVFGGVRDYHSSRTHNFFLVGIGWPKRKYEFFVYFIFLLLTSVGGWSKHIVHIDTTRCANFWCNNGLSSLSSLFIFCRILYSFVLVDNSISDSMFDHYTMQIFFIVVFCNVSTHKHKFCAYFQLKMLNNWTMSIHCQINRPAHVCIEYVFWRREHWSHTAINWWKFFFYHLILHFNLNFARSVDNWLVLKCLFSNCCSFMFLALLFSVQSKIANILNEIDGLHQLKFHCLIVTITNENEKFKFFPENYYYFIAFPNTTNTCNCVN